MAKKFPGVTVKLTDTIDQFSRKLHINVRNGKVTQVYRWKSKGDDREHTQRTTLDQEQVSDLMAALVVAQAHIFSEGGNRNAQRDYSLKLTEKVSALSLKATGF